MNAQVHDGDHGQRPRRYDRLGRGRREVHRVVLKAKARSRPNAPQQVHDACLRRDHQGHHGGRTAFQEAVLLRGTPSLAEAAVEGYPTLRPRSYASRPGSQTAPTSLRLTGSGAATCVPPRGVGVAICPVWSTAGACRSSRPIHRRPPQPRSVQPAEIGRAY